MKVVHLTHTDVRTDSRILKQLSALHIEGYSVTGIGIDFDEGAKVADIYKDIQLITLNVKSNSLRKKKYIPSFIVHFIVMIELTFKMFLTIQRIRPAVIQCHDTIVLPLGLISKLLFKSKIIYDAHELESDKAGLSKISSVATLLLEKISWSSINALIVVSDSIENWYTKKFGCKESVVILNSPIVSQAKLSDDNSYLRKRFLIPEEAKIFVYVGLFSKGRSIEELIRIFSLGNISSHIVFIGYGELQTRISEAAAGIANIHHHEAVKHYDLVSILKGADYGLCLIPNISLSDYYCLPNKLFEYVFAGLPVLASDMPEISKFVVDNDVGFVCDLTHNGILSEIKRIEGNDVKVRVFPEKLGIYSWQAQELKLINLYSKIKD